MSKQNIPIPVDGIFTLASQLIDLIKTGIEKRGLLRERVNRLEQALLKAAESNLIQDEESRPFENRHLTGHAILRDYGGKNATD